MARTILTNATIVGEEVVDSGNRPAHPIYDPPQIWGPPGPWPAPPIYIQIPPGVIDGHPEHPIFLPVYPEHPIYLPPGWLDGVHPEHPIYLPPYRPEHPIYLPPGIIGGPPPRPEHPIYLPPVIWPPDAHPEHPIVLPDPPTEQPPEGWSWGYTVRFGWVAVPDLPGKPRPPHPATP